MTAIPNDIDLMTAICCGDHCRTETGVCHKRDHIAEAWRVKALLERHQRSRYQGEHHDAND